MMRNIRSTLLFASSLFLLILSACNSDTSARNDSQKEVGSSAAQAGNRSQDSGTTATAPEEELPPPQPPVVNTVAKVWAQSRTSDIENTSSTKLLQAETTDGQKLDYAVYVQRGASGDVRDLVLSKEALEAGKPFDLKITGVDLWGAQVFIRQGETVEQIQPSDSTSTEIVFENASLPAVSPGSQDIIVVRAARDVTIRKDAVTVR